MGELVSILGIHKKQRAVLKGWMVKGDIKKGGKTNLGELVSILGDF